MISGFLFLNSLKEERFVDFALKKCGRLLLPALFFGALYLVVFPQFMFSKSPVNGTHLWYLPMLFVLMVCCFPLKMRQSNVFLRLFVLLSLYALLRIGRHFALGRTFFEACDYYQYFLIGALSCMFLRWFLVRFSVPERLENLFSYTQRLPRWVAFVDKYSFFIYLTHQFFINLGIVLVYRRIADGWFNIGVCFALTLSCCLLLSLLVDFLRLKYRFLGL